MIRTSFNDGWQFRPKVNPFAEMAGGATPFEPVTIPHDAMLGRPRAAEHDGAGAYFPGGAYEYRKTFHVPEELRGQRVLLEFEGVYRDAMVFCNGDYAGQHRYGYSCFAVDLTGLLKFGQDNEIRVEARTHQDSRWYTGAGIYRDTWLLTGDLVRIDRNGIRVRTPDTDADRAVIEVATRIMNDSITLATVELTTEIQDPAGEVVATSTTVVTVPPGEPAIARQRLYVREPALWNTDSPNLYRANVTLIETETETVTFGIRTLRLDPEHGLRINGETVKLRGACVHHDNGPLGAATFARAEERRVTLLKEAGFNALRMSHHPMSTALLAACDRLGMLVIDETFDMWTQAKNPFDYSLDFPEWWEREVAAMVAKDVNHPCVIMYSIGNEIPETGSPAGTVWGRRIAEKIRSLDGTRFVTNAINPMLAVLPALAELRDEGAGINTLMADIGAAMNAIAASELVSRRTAESFGVLDVAGMNYAESRYALDRELFPGRIILGTETFPTHIAGNWRLVQQHSHVIGDFTWTGWDYLGEVGIGRPRYADQSPEFAAPFPYLLAHTGDLDITGRRRPVSYYREIVFGLRTRPYLAMRRPEHFGEPVSGTPWAWSDSVSSWTWPGFEDKPIVVEVYSDADEIELLLDDRVLGRRPINDFRTEFETVYQPGTLTAVAYRDGIETGRDLLRTTTGPIALHAEPDRPTVTTAHGDLAYVTLTLTGAADRLVTVQVTGSGQLAALGSARPETGERFDSGEHTTYEGRALAIIRPTGPGKIRLTATAPDCDPAEIVLTVEDPA